MHIQCLRPGTDAGEQNRGLFFASSDVVLSQKFHYSPGFHQIKHQCYKPHPFHALAKVVFNTGKAKPQESSPKPKIFQ